ncbi:lytic transglycosylase domain-containing protein [Croceibacterium mercuriale]|uniref:lytic transglycosylase domain-containing protein n=1 Tax=Croceibacterium mercuriale TaxID=1572751 RepID=UPI001269EBFA|nr:lytic transglycosylase domain-containing protein [Croceibacterium mercuriale]
MKRSLFCIALLLASSKAVARDVEVHVFKRSPSSEFQLIEPGRDPDAIARGEPPAILKREASAVQSGPVPSKLDIVPQRLAIPVPAWMRGGRQSAAVDRTYEVTARNSAGCSFAPYRPYVGLSPSGETRRQLYYRDMVQAACTAGVPVALFDSLIVQESRYSPRAISSAGAIGIAQLMPGTARGLRVANPWDVRENLSGGARYLRQQLDEFGQWHLALSAYNAGPGNVRRHGGVPPFRETTRYVRAILSGTRLNHVMAQRSEFNAGRRIAHISYPGS